MTGPPRHRLGVHGHLPMGVALLLAVIFGVLLVALPMAVRVVQLRLMATRHRGRIAAAVQQEGASRGR
jgi:lipopolysaccharide assembly protein A